MMQFLFYFPFLLLYKKTEHPIFIVLCLIPPLANILPLITKAHYFLLNNAWLS